jgi:hypothetical protein
MVEHDFSVVPEPETLDVCMHQSCGSLHELCESLLVSLLVALFLGDRHMIS